MSTELAGTSWLVVEGFEVPSGVNVTAEFGDGVVAGSSGCNTYRAPYEVDGERLRLTGPLASTRKLCPEPVMATEYEMTSRLERVASFRLRAGHLALLDADGQVLMGLRPASGMDLLGAWQVVSLHRPDRNAITSVTGDLHLRFDGGAVSGDAGCNTFSGSWSLAGRELRIGPLAVTMRACPDMDEEEALLRALDAVRGWRLGAEHVDLLRGDGGIAVSLRRREA